MRDANTKGDGILVGSSNLTKAGLSGNLELNLGRYERPVIERAREWFDELWDEATPYDLSEIFEAGFWPRTPWEIFLRVLYQLYGGEIEEDAKVDDNLPLTSFQKHGVARALRLIRDTGGAIIADEVGLGKTFMAGELLQIYRERRQRALLICPAELRDTTWRKFLTRFQLFVECVSYEELANDIQLRDALRPDANQQKLQRPLDEYQFVVVDEAHNCRNPDAPTRAGVLRRLMFGRRRDLLLLTATPVNNSLWDLYHLVRFFVRQDAHFADRGILSIRKPRRAGDARRPVKPQPRRALPHHRRDHGQAHPAVREEALRWRQHNRARRTPNAHRVPGARGQSRFATTSTISSRGSSTGSRKHSIPTTNESITFARYTPDAYLLGEWDG